VTVFQISDYSIIIRYLKHRHYTSGERFIVELQKAKQNYFKDRRIYYPTFPIQEQAQRGQWDFKLDAVYTVGVLDFMFDEDRAENDFDVIHTVQLKNQKGELFYDKLTFIYLTLPNFTKNLNELETMQDKWFYALRHLADMESVPPIFQDSVFQQLFETAQIACFNPDERQAYESSLKYYRDLKNVMDTAKDEAWNQGHAAGHEEGHEKGRTEGLEEGSQQATLDIARNLLDILDDTTIAEKTGLTLAEIAPLRVKD
jgi:predicted transposase/invertase (TIGR01784 family)